MSYELSSFQFFRQCISLSVALAGVIADYNQQISLLSVHYINLYAIIDSFFVKTPDMLIHHLLVISCVSVIAFYEINEAYKLNFIGQLMRFEYSSIFYSGGPIVFHYLSKNQYLVNNVKIAFHVLFAVTFIKYRIWDYSRNVVLNREIYTPANFSTNIGFVQLILSSWGFYALNLYWARLILLKLIHSCKKTHN